MGRMVLGGGMNGIFVRALRTIINDFYICEILINIVPEYYIIYSRKRNEWKKNGKMKKKINKT